MAATAALVFAGKSIATPAISFIVNKAFSYLSEWHQAEGMEAVKDRLLQRLSEIQAVYAAVNLEQIEAQNGSALNRWLWRFRDAVEGAEDALDEVDYYKLEEEAHARNLQHQVRNPVISFIRERVVERFVRHASEGKMVKTLRKALEDLDGVAKGVCTFLQLISRFDTHPLIGHAESSYQQTSSALTATEFFGRDREKEQIMRWLTDKLDEGSSTSRNSTIPVFAIIGIGGIGKTTLGQLVCRDLEGSSHFEIIVLAHVSGNTFSVTRITKKILEAITKQKPNAETLQALQQILKLELENRKFLLILDDVWEDGQRMEWELLMAPFQTSQRGSRILLTTRMQSVADMKVAFEDLKAEDYTHLLRVAKKIVLKFQGCPLVTKIAGGYLKENVSEQYWENLHTQLEQLEGKLDVIVMTVLRSSYRHLPEDLQLCFRYCSIFPKNYMFKKDGLVKMWMGSGLIHVKGGMERPEDIGEGYLAQLTRKSFFSFVPTGDPYSKHYTGYYIMHDLLHDLARNVSFSECVRLEYGDYMHDRHTVRHLWIAKFSKLTIEEIEAIPFFKNLRTLVIESSSDLGIVHVHALERAVENLKGLRLLILKRVPKFCFAKEVANKHLRYVSFSGMQEVQGLSKLYHLQILASERSINLGPEQLKKLGNLSRLRYVSYGINGFGEFFVVGLSSLQELHNFQVQEKEGYQIHSLRNLSKLCKLKMCNLENVRSHKEIIKAKLSEKFHLRSLSLNWSETNDAPKDEDDRILDQLEPHTRLQNLEIACYNGVRFPSWFNHLSLTNMVSLELRRCGKWVRLPAFGKLKLLKHLELQKLTELKQIGISPDVSLPQNLKTLVVEGCKELRELPLLPPSLVQLEINDVGLSTLPRIEERHGTNMGSEGMPPKLVLVIIRECPNLTSLERSFLLQEHYVRALRILSIVDCVGLITAPLLFGKMNQLTEFRIGSCSKLEIMRNPEDKQFSIPNTLKELSMVECRGFEVPLLNSLFGLTNLTSLNLCDCAKVESLPSPRVFTSLQALREIFVTRCSSLLSLGGMGVLPYLTWLEITGCPSLHRDEYYSFGKQSESFPQWISPSLETNKGYLTYKKRKGYITASS
ncbi:LOW QUALITY PROTEIN: disease resistance protein RGA2-like [Setaria italica]|uniref:LOW QUALITY PROTEIN: disease resistance protein RGA2-like n=1 Tax=Setaria italica TaxID=4555 RepID=UPI000BE51C87|nr:LOW QUALITY PROTEIN: disease resistance protein RGA2-like [Setaria italica]